MDHHCLETLERPIVATEGQSGSTGLDAEQQRASQEIEAARISKVFAAPTTSADSLHAAPQETVNNTASTSDETFAQNGQDRKLLFVNAPVDRRTTAPDFGPFGTVEASHARAWTVHREGRLLLRSLYLGEHFHEGLTQPTLRRHGIVALVPE